MARFPVRSALTAMMMVVPVLLAAMPASAAEVTLSRTFGGSKADEGTQVVVDAQGFLYIVGSTQSLDFPVVNALQPTFGGVGNLIGSTHGDLFVMKLTPAGTTVWSTYLGGSGGDRGGGIAVDGAGDVYVVGFTNSLNIPTTPGAAQRTYGGGESDTFIAKIRGDGSALVYATYLGGSGREIPEGIAVDSAGRVFVGGDTTSTNYPIVNGFDATFNGGFNDAMVTRLSADGSTIEGSTYLGGSIGDEIDGLSLDAAGNVLAVGWTESANFPTKNAYDATFNGGSFPGDAWVAKLAPSLSTLVFSTFIGGSAPDSGSYVLEDERGDLHVIGHTSSTNFPTLRPVQPSFAGGSRDAFLVTLSGDGSTLKYATYLGGSGTDNMWGLAFGYETHTLGDTTFELPRTLLTGWTTSTNFPKANAMQSTNAGLTDIFVAQIDEAKGALRFSTLLGGSGDEGVFRPMALPNGDLLLAAWSNSPDLPVPDYANAGSMDAVLLRLSVPPPEIGGSTTGSGGGSNGWHRGPRTIARTCAAPSATTMTYQLDGAAETPYASPVLVEGDGTHTFDTVCVDAFGNVGESRELVPIDATPPLTTAEPVGVAGNAGWYRSPVRVSLGCADLTSGCASTLAEQVDGSEPCCSFAPDGVEVTADGIHHLRYRSRDVAGNLEADRELDVKVDTHAPVTTAEPVGTLGNQGWYRSAVQVGLACSDATSGCAASVAEDVANAEPVGVEPVGREGLTRVRYRSEDIAGNAEADNLLELRIDSIAPRTTVEPVGLAGRNGWWRSAVTVGLACADATSGCAASIAENIANAEPVGAEPVGAQGTTNLRFRSDDVAGNTEADQALELRIDSVAPRTAAEPVGVIGNAGWFRSAVLVGFACSDATSGCGATHATVDGAAVESPTTATVQVVGDGAHEVAFASDDVAGNLEDEAQLPLRIDATPPTVALLAPVRGNLHLADAAAVPLPVMPPCDAGAPAEACAALLAVPDTVVVGQVTLRAEAADATSGVQEVRFLVDGEVRSIAVAGKGAFVFAWDAGAEAAGEHTLTVEAVDVAGNEAASEPLTVFTVPTSAEGAMATAAELGLPA